MFKKLASSVRMASTFAGPGIQVVPHKELHVSKPTWWLESRFHFSFADYYDPAREHFGVLRVLNDDIVQPKAGFGRHPHRDAEIFSYVLDGKLSHRDSMGNQEALPRGSVQYLSAGTGITHSEMNEMETPVRFLQLWITPDRRGHEPQYGSREFDKADRHNRLLHLIGGTGTMPAWPNVNGPSTIQLHQDCNVFVSEVDPGHETRFELGARRQVYLIVAEGSVAVNGTPLATRDGAKIRAGPTPLPVSIAAGAAGAHFLFVEMAEQE